MKTLNGLCAALLLAALNWVTPAAAQGIPPGSYLRSCSGARVEGDTLIARCRRVDGFEQRSALPNLHRCVGDIANANGVLRCAYRQGPPPAAAPVPTPNFIERCQALRHQAFELRQRIERTFDPFERARLEERLRGVRREAAPCPR
jgi:uncharacterized protein DUF6381/CVNH domain-containing protein